MSSKTITSLAVLKVHWDTYKKDYIENFVPFIVHLIALKKYKTIDIKIMCDDFLDEYGISIPYHPMVSILNRVKKRKFLKRVHHELQPINSKIIEGDFSSKAIEQQTKINKVVNEFIEFTKDVYGTDISENEAEDGFIGYLKEFDLEILFAGHDVSVLPSVSTKKSSNFLISRFIRHTYENDPLLFGYILDISIGHILASTVLFDGLNKYLGKLKNQCYYLDTNILLELLGTHGDDRKKIFEEFISILIESKVKLFVFEHTQDEAIRILETCQEWIDSKNFDSSKASPTLNFFVVGGYTISDIERFIAKVPLVLDKHEIEVIDKPDYTKYKDFQIDEEGIKEKIIHTYRRYNPSFNEHSKKRTIEKDVDSIAAIYRLRKGRRPRSFKEAKHILVTRNCTLAEAINNFEKENNQNFCINACLTDTFIGTLIWLQSPAKIVDINSKKLIADTYAAIQPDSLLIKKYLDEINKLRNNEIITVDEYYLLRSHRVAINLLEVKTLGDPDKLTSKTPQEILDEIKNSYKLEGKVKYIQESEKHKKTIQSLEDTKSKLSNLELTMQALSTKVSKVISWLIFIILLLVLIYILLFQLIPNISSYSIAQNITMGSILIIFTVLNIGYGFNLMGFRKTIYKKIYNSIFKFLINFNEKSKN